MNGDQGLQTVAGLIAKGWVVATEFDDHPDFFEGMRSPRQYAFQGVHAVQTSTAALADIIRDRNPEVATFPNAVRELP